MRVRVLKSVLHKKSTEMFGKEKRRVVIPGQMAEKSSGQPLPNTAHSHVTCPDIGAHVPCPAVHHEPTNVQPVVRTDENQPTNHRSGTNQQTYLGGSNS